MVWSDDGATVEKRYDRMSRNLGGRRHEQWTREWRVGMLLGRQPPPVPHARLLSAAHGRRSLRFEAIDGDPLGPKFPLELRPDDVVDLAALASAVGRYRPQARFLRRFDPAGRQRHAVAEGALTSVAASALRRQIDQDPPSIGFGHGDITARNVLRSTTTGQAVLIDWEWAGWYPRPWDQAFLWFTLVDLPGGRAAVEATVAAEDEPWFWRSALLIQCLHLTLAGLAPGTPFRKKHERMRDELVERVLAT